MYSPREMRVSKHLKPLSSPLTGVGVRGAFSPAALAPVLGFSKPYPSCLSLFFPRQMAAGRRLSPRPQ